MNKSGDTVSNVQVAIRVRPLLEHEKSEGHHQTTLCLQNDNEILLNYSKNEEQSRHYDKAFQFDKIFNPNHSQADIYRELNMKKLISQVLEGYHATVFAYGQTGSGKTYTLEGLQDQVPENKASMQAQHKYQSERDNNIGIVPRMINDIFKKAKRLSTSNHITLQCSFLQIYNEKVFDLLNDLHQQVDMNKATGLKIRWNKQDQFQVENLFTFECESKEQMIELYQQGIKNRAVASHKLNQSSSRSHAIFSITIESINKQNLKEVITSKLQLVDLAGSEKNAFIDINNNNNNIHNRESIQINKSLFVLRKVINALTLRPSTNNPSPVKKGNEYVPYRDSKLTSLLKQSLGGNSLTIMIACINPSDLFIEENVSTLKYATKASRIKNKPVKNIDENMQLMQKLRERISELELELKNANEHIEFLSQGEGKLKDCVEFCLDSTLYEQNYERNNHQTIHKSTIAEEFEPYKINKQLLDQSQFYSFLHQIIEQKDSTNQIDQKINDYFGQTTTKITELLRSNNQLRMEIKKLQEEKHISESKVFHITLENEALIQKNEQLERIQLNKVQVPYESITRSNYTSSILSLERKFPSKNTFSIVDTNSVKTLELAEIKKQISELQKRNSLLEYRTSQLQRDSNQGGNFETRNQPHFNQVEMMMPNCQSVIQVFTSETPQSKKNSDKILITPNYFSKTCDLKTKNKKTDSDFLKKQCEFNSQKKQHCRANSRNVKGNVVRNGISIPNTPVKRKLSEISEFLV